MKSPDERSDRILQPPARGSAEWHNLLTAHHEAGHAVMALILGRAIQKVTIKPGQLQSGGIRLGQCEFKKGHMKASSDPLEDEVLILMAGMVAEARITGEYCRQGASQDLQVARRMLRTRVGTERQIERLERRLLSKAEHLLRDEAAAAAITLLAQELLDKKTVSGRAARHFYAMARQQNA